MLVPCYVYIYIYIERERERERERECSNIQKIVANQQKVKKIYSYISYVIHTSLIHFICFCKFQLLIMCGGGFGQVWQQQASRKQQIGCPCVLPMKAKNAINTIIKAFTTNCL